MKLPSIRDIDIKDKRVFLRADLDVPLSEVRSQKSEVRIEDDTRLKAALPTIEYLLNNDAQVIIGGHLGRPNVVNKKPKTLNQEQFSLEPVASWIFEQFRVQNKERIMDAVTMGGFEAWKLDEKLFVLENLRFYDGEEANDPAFAKKLVTLADVYINDAFSVVHRDHASVVGIAKILPHAAGLRLEKELEVFSNILAHPARPLVVIIGGVKLETKLPVISHMARIADHVLVGGKIAQEAKETSETVYIADLTPDGFDITPESVKRFKEIISKAKTIVWNGPLGLIKEDSVDTEKGTRDVAQAIAQSSAYKIVGGGDTLDYLQKLGIVDKFDFVSTGGGAMLAFLSGETLPGLEALRA